jgi:hypothetical protein
MILEGKYFTNGVGKFIWDLKKRKKFYLPQKETHQRTFLNPE